ncbi:twin-arginine translocase subunit TatC [Laceyella putida]|uniref:Sec-independent protein translocase protein TatC n=1 Tax=Laceyella putida TaxID=110101 RepID=A0ABW2RKP8_9BACL
MKNDELQPLSDHLGELRRRIIWCLLFYVIALVVSFSFSMEIFGYIKNDLIPKEELNTMGPTDGLRIYMNISFLLAFIITLPILLYHVWQFVRPGLHPREQRAALLYIPVAVGLFLLGIAFGYFVIVPYLLEFLLGISKQMQLGTLFNVKDTFSFLFGVILPLGAFFELPIIILFLTRIRLVTPQLLVKMRRYAYFIMVVIAAVITPPDFASNILVAIPLIVLYEISIWLSVWLAKKMEREEAEQEMEASQTRA